MEFVPRLAGRCLWVVEFVPRLAGWCLWVVEFVPRLAGWCLWVVEFVSRLAGRCLWNFETRPDALSANIVSSDGTLNHSRNFEEKQHIR